MCLDMQLKEILMEARNALVIYNGGIGNNRIKTDTITNIFLKILSGLKRHNPA